MAKDQGLNITAPRNTARTAKGAPASRPVVVAPPGGTPAVVKPKTSPGKFLQEARAEARKITWTSWKETWITSVMVGVMVLLTSVFFLVVDWGLGLFIQQILKLAA